MSIAFTFFTGETMKPTLLRLCFLIAIVSLGSCTSLLHKTGLLWERSYSDIESNVVIVDKFVWHYSETGNQGEVILAIHGFGGDRDHWTRFARHFGPGFKVIAPDLPGFGQNLKIPGESYTIAEQVKRLHDFVQTIELKQFHIVGNSMGGHIAGVYAATYPNEVKSLILIDNAGVKSPSPSKMQTMMQNGEPNPLLVTSVEDFDRLMAFSFVKPPYIPGFMKSHFAKKAIENRPWNESIFQQLRSEGYLLESKLSSIKAKTLVIWGDSDRVIDVSVTDVLKQKMKPSPKIEIMYQVGHAPMIEVPEDTANLVINWIQSLKQK